MTAEGMVRDRDKKKIPRRQVTDLPRIGVAEPFLVSFSSSVSSVVIIFTHAIC
jgi:hypothetical protein